MGEEIEIKYIEWGMAMGWEEVGSCLLIHNLMNGKTLTEGLFNNLKYQSGIKIKYSS